MAKDKVKLREQLNVTIVKGKKKISGIVCAKCGGDTKRVPDGMLRCYNAKCGHEFSDPEFEAPN